MTKEQLNTTDERWGRYVPWFLRHRDFPGTGDFHTFFFRLSQRLERLFLYNESGIANLLHFGACLESESLQRFRYTAPDHLFTQIQKFFNSPTIAYEARNRLAYDHEEKGIHDIERKINIIRTSNMSAESNEERVQSLESKLADARLIAMTTKERRFESHYRSVVIERMGVLESLLRILPNQSSACALQLKRDIRRFFAEAEIMLDIKGDPPLIVPMEEPLLQKEVLDKLLPRLESLFPERAKELIKAYHDSIEGNNLDAIFSEAFKTLEEIARSLTKDSSFMFDKKNLNKYYPELHPTIHETMIRLAGHRGDEAGHGRSAPDPHEIRYLLFSICNIALLLLDYNDKNVS